MDSVSIHSGDIIHLKDYVEARIIGDYSYPSNKLKILKSIMRKEI